MTEDILDRVNALSAHLGRYKPTPREKTVGRTVAYYERLGAGHIPYREGRAKANRGQVPLVVKQGVLMEVEEFGAGGEG